MDLLLSFSERLKEVMLEKNLTADIISKDINVVPSAICKWCTMTSIPSLENLIALADYLNYTTDYLLGLKDISDISTFKKAPVFSTQLKIIFNTFSTTEYKVSKATNISRSRFHGWLSGRNVPLVDNIVKLAMYFECTTDYIIGRE